MTDPIKVKFFRSQVKIESKGQSIHVDAMISAKGATRIFFHSGLPPFLSAVPEPIIVHIGPMSVHGVLLRKFVESGSYFEVQFWDLSSPQKEFLEQRLIGEGFSPGWKREYPRIPVAGLYDPDLPVPNLCMIRFEGKEIFASVVNFTLGGIRVETNGDFLDTVKVGAELNFDLMANTGDVMENISAEVRNMSVNQHTTDQGQYLTRSLGMRISRISEEAEATYRRLIRDYCLVLQRRLQDKP